MSENYFKDKKHYDIVRNCTMDVKRAMLNLHTHIAQINVKVKCTK